MYKPIQGITILLWINNLFNISWSQNLQTVNIRELIDDYIKYKYKNNVFFVIYTLKL